MVFTLFFVQWISVLSTRACWWRGRQEMMSQEESDHFTWRSFHRHTKMAGSIFSSFPSSSCRMSYFCWVFLNWRWRRVTKGVRNANAIATSPGDGRHMAEVSLEPQPLLMAPQHHMMYVLAIRRPVWLARTQPSLVIPDSHCTGFLSQPWDVDLADCKCENCIYIMHLPGE